MSGGTVEGAGAALAYRETGAGRPVVVVHDVASDAAVWAPELARLGGRAIAYDRRGYGASSAPEGYSATSVEEQAEDLAALLVALAAAPGLVIGDGFGALVALDAAKRHPRLVAGLVLADVPLFAFVPAATQAIAERRSVLEDALRAGGQFAAIAAYLGPGADSSQLERAQRCATAVFADYAGASSWPVTRRELRALTVTTAVLTRPGATPTVLAAADALAGLLPDAARVHDGDPVAEAAMR